MKKRGECVLCGVGPATRPRRTCWSCYARRRHEAPTLPNHGARRGSGAGAGNDRGRGEPTDALPGTEAKLAVMEARAAAGLAVFHEGDARWAD